MKRDTMCMRGLGIVCGIALLFVMGAALDADAQRGGGQQLSDEDAKAVWNIQARSVSRKIGVAREDAGKVSAAYLASRENYQKAMTELRASSGGGRGGFQGFREAAAKERGKLEEALKGILKDKQLTEAMASLGTFDRQWDGFTNTLRGFELERPKRQEAMSLTIAYVSEVYKAREEAMENEDFQAMREISTKSKTTLDEGMAKVLSEEDQTKWTEATAGRGRRGGGGGGGTRRPRNN